MPYPNLQPTPCTENCTDCANANRDRPKYGQLAIGWSRGSMRDTHAADVGCASNEQPEAGADDDCHLA